MEISARAVAFQEQGSYAPIPPVRTVEEPAATEDISMDAVPASETASAPKVRSPSDTENGEMQQNREEEEERKSAGERKKVKNAVSEINRNANGTEAIFGIHEKTNRVTIKIVDKKSKEVLKEVPPEKTLDLIAKAWELAGILVDEKR